MTFPYGGQPDGLSEASPMGASTGNDGDGPNVAVRDLVGRVIIALPDQLDTGVPKFGKPGEVEDRIRFTALVVDGPILTIGGNRDNGFQPTHTVQVPCIAPNVLSSHVSLLRELRPYVQKGPIFGRIVRGEARGEKNAPLLFVGLEQHETELRAKVSQAWAAFTSNSYPHPEPQPIAPPAAPPVALTQLAPWGQQQAVASPQIPGGWTPQQWAALSPQQQAQVLSAQPPAF
jgi:hypothetical protein